MNTKNTIIVVGVSVSVILVTGACIVCFHQTGDRERPGVPQIVVDPVETGHPGNISDPALVGPKGNVSEGTSGSEEFELFAIPVPGVLSRSGQPTLDGFRWLKGEGWKGVVDFREDGEKGNPYAVDSRLSGFDELGFNFLSLPIRDGGTPTDDQADRFLAFVTDPRNQPVHVHCAAGIGRTGVAVALYRYSVQGWPMDKAIEETSLFTKSISKSQQEWLRTWASDNKPGGYRK